MKLLELTNRLRTDADWLKTATPLLATVRSQLGSEAEIGVLVPIIPPLSTMTCPVEPLLVVM